MWCFLLRASFHWLISVKLQGFVPRFIFQFNLHCQEFGSPLRWCFRFSSTLTQILEAWNEELLLLEDLVSDQKQKKTKMLIKCFEICWSYSNHRSLKAIIWFNKLLYKMFNHGRPICVFGPLLVSHTLPWPWLVYSFLCLEIAVF